MQSVQLSAHDAQTFELHVTPENYVMQRRFSVLVPRDVSRRDLFNAASLLAAYVYLTTNQEVRWSRQSLGRTLYQQRQVGIVRTIFQDVTLHLDTVLTSSFARGRIDEATARDKARILLHELDPVLLEKIDAGCAFYFCTPRKTYIWYPRDKAIVSLDEDAPHFVCVHSRDPHVERNLYDWAITMRTYILGDEERWRTKANFHPEWYLRGGRNAYGS